MNINHLTSLVLVIVCFQFPLNATTMASRQDAQFIVDNRAKYAGSGSYVWQVFLKPTPRLADIKEVEYTLHPTIRNPVRKGIGKDFHISDKASGEFNIVVKIVYNDWNRKPTIINYWLKLFDKAK